MRGVQAPSRALVALAQCALFLRRHGSSDEDEAEVLTELTCPATEELVFGTDDARKWQAALAEIGVDALMLSADAGRA